MLAVAWTVPVLAGVRREANDGWVVPCQLCVKVRALPMQCGRHEGEM